MRLLSLLALLACFSVAQAQTEPSLLVNTDIFGLEYASDPQISPDATRIAYVRQSMDIMTDRAKASVWLLNADGSDHRPILTGSSNYTNPRWSPDGDRLAYVSATDGGGQTLYVLWLDTGVQLKLADLPKPPAALSWSPDGSQLAFSMLVPTPGPTLAPPPAKPANAEWADPPVAYDALHFRSDGRGYIENGDNQIFVIPADSGTPRQVTFGDFNHNAATPSYPRPWFSPIQWSRDGGTLIITTHREASHELEPLAMDVWAIDLADGAMVRLTDRDGPDFAPVISPDGRRIVYLGYEDDGYAYANVQAYVMDLDGNNKQPLTANLNRSVTAANWTGTDSLIITYEDRGQTRLAELDLAGSIEPIASNVGGTSLGRPYTSGSFSVATDGTFAYTAGSPYRPGEVAVGSGNQDIEILTSLNEDLLATRTLGQVEEITWTSPAEDLSIQGWLIKPPNFDPNVEYPLILEIHGGPHLAYGPDFSAELQLFAAAGYVVLYANQRGSTTYGYEFAAQIAYQTSEEEYQDLMSGVEAVIEMGFVDEDRLYVAGGSNGGYMSAWIIGTTDRFRAAAVVKPLTNWISQALTTDIPRYAINYWFDSMPWEDPEHYWDKSPLSLAGNVTTPTLLITGEQDYRTPSAETEQYYRALKLQGVDSMMIRFPDTPHGIAGRPSRLIAKVDNTLAWFDRYSD